MGCAQFVTVGFAVTPLYFVWEKILGVHQASNMLLRASCRVPVILPIWFLAVAFPFFGAINSLVGCLLVTFTVYIIPCLAHMVYFRNASLRAVITSSPNPISLPMPTLKVTAPIPVKCTYQLHSSPKM
jgi:auxin influx carrier (AUX1 LAX family)